jgi:nucleotide-binding universal stress UspA family protein
MDNIRKVLVPFDLKSDSEESLLLVAELARAINAEVILYNVCPESKASDIGLQLIDIAHKYNKLTLVDFKYQLDYDNLFQQFENRCKVMGPDLVFFRTHGIKGISQHLFGANSVKMLEHCEVPVCISSGVGISFSSGVNVTMSMNYGVFKNNHNFQTMLDLLKGFKSNVHLYAINTIINEEVQEMHNEAKRIENVFGNQGIKSDFVIANKNDASISFAKQLVEHAHSVKSLLIVVNYHFTEFDKARLKADAEYLINNPYQIPVLFV